MGAEDTQNVGDIGVRGCSCPRSPPLKPHLRRVCHRGLLLAASSSSPTWPDWTRSSRIPSSFYSTLLSHSTDEGQIERYFVLKSRGHWGIFRLISWFYSWKFPLSNTLDIVLWCYIFFTLVSIVFIFFIWRSTKFSMNLPKPLFSNMCTSATGWSLA